ncbi:MAG: MauE/DoxX family redox-associated membrane protein [Ilumatobacter sp.]|uniref:MauE/DoxX family redox-associated membrane protein n=1 Tax=Ilumatobacter sp. TaxID=1967498 RepID=UPI0032984CF3
MSLIPPIAAVLVGVAFVVAGGSKLAARASWPAQARGLGAPAWTVPLVPWVELGIGASLIVQLLRVPMAVAAALLLFVFSALIVRKLAAGEHPPCACFGAWSVRPIGWGHVGRNAALLVLAAVATL